MAPGEIKTTRARSAAGAPEDAARLVGELAAQGVVAIIGQPEGVVRGHVQAVGAAEHALAPRAQKVAVAIEHDHRVRAAIERVDAVLPVDAHRGHVGVELAARRQLGPVVDDLVAIGARAQDDRHAHLRGEQCRTAGHSTAMRRDCRTVDTLSR